MALEANERVRYPPRSGHVPRRGGPPPTSPRPPKLLDRVREANRLRHGSRCTEKSYAGWIRRYILKLGRQALVRELVVEFRG